MYTKLIRNILLFFGLLVMQLFICDNIRFGGYVKPCVYILFVMLMPFSSSRVKLMFNGFLIGMAVDIYNGTPGLNAAAMVLIAYLRPYIISLMTRKNELEGKTYPSIAEMEIKWFSIYAALLLIIHNLTLFLLEAFSFRLFHQVLLEVLISVPVSLILIILFCYVIKPLK